MVEKTISRLRRDLFNRFVYAGADGDEYDPNLYARSTRAPPTHLVSQELKDRIDNFESELRQLFKRRKSPSNLLQHQRNCLETLRNCSDLMVCKTDKNLGPAIIERRTYFNLAFRDHLSDQQTYRKLSKTAAENRMIATNELLGNWMRDNKKILPAQELTYLKRTRTLRGPNGEIIFPQFYILAKIHKDPLMTRPIVSISGSLLHGLGRWADRQLQPIARAILSYIKSSVAFLEKIRTQQEIAPFPPTALLFTCDAVSMYTNIDTDRALHNLSSRVPGHVVDALRIIMKNNIFQFSDTWWRQLEGTAMGTPPACMWATLFFAEHEEFLCTKYARYLLHWSRFIDDGFGVWDWDNSPECLTAFANFKLDIQYGKLRWEINEPSHTVHYLDLTLTIANGKIDSTLYEKALNLYLYLPPSSAHPPGVLKGLIAGAILRILRLTTNPHTRKKHVKVFYTRLVARGYTPSHIRPIFDTYLRKYMTTAQAQQPAAPPRTTDDCAFLHVPYHPLDPSSKEIQAAFRKHLLKENPPNPYLVTPLPKLCNGKGHKLGINRLIVAYHRPRNIGNFLTPRHVDRLPGLSASAFLLERDEREQA